MAKLFLMRGCHMVLLVSSVNEVTGVVAERLQSCLRRLAKPGVPGAQVVHSTYQRTLHHNPIR